MSTNFGKTGAPPKMGEQPDQTPHSQMNLQDSVADSQTAESKADLYTTAPWAKRTELSQPAAPSESSSGDPTAGKSILSPFITVVCLADTTGSNPVPSSSSTQAIMQQLLACHATMRQQQQRIDGLEKELILTTMRHQQRIDDLGEELSQCRKHEEAGQDMFLQLYRENRKICAERRCLDAKEKHLEETKACLEHDRMLFEANAAPQSEKSDVKDESPVKEKRGLGEISPFAASRTCQFQNKDLSLWKISDTDRAKIVALRYKHEYYRGWLDAKRSDDDKDNLGMLKQELKCRVRDSPIETLNDIFEKVNPWHPFTAGLNAGVLFGWSALCNLHDLPQHDVRLDNCKWNLQNLLAEANYKETHDQFWEGLYQATEKMQQEFTRKLKSGVWILRDDRIQMNPLQPILYPRGRQTGGGSEGYPCQEEQSFLARGCALE
jgi:hypothetical protein